MAFKLKFQGKSKELYGSNNPMVRKGLVTPTYLMEGPGDEKKVPKGNQSDADNQATQDAKSNMKVVSTEKRKVKGGTELVENLEGVGKGKTYKEAGVDPAEAKAYWDANPDKYQEYLAKKKLKDQRITFIPDDEPEKDPKPDPKPKQEAKPVDKNIGTKIITERVLDPSSPKRWDGRLGKYVPNYIDVKRRVAVSATGDDKISKDLDQNVQYSSTGDADRVENVVTDQLEQKTMSNALDPATIIKGAMMVKNLIDKKKDK